MTTSKMPANADTWTVRDSAGLGRAISQIRRRQGLTQADLADMAGINRQYVSEIERGRTTEQTERLLVLLRRLGMELTLTPKGS